MQSVEFTIAFLNSMLSAIHQHVNLKDLKQRKKLVLLLGGKRVNSVESLLRK